MVQPGFEPVVSHSADRHTAKWANHVVYTSQEDVTDKIIMYHRHLMLIWK